METTGYAHGGAAVARLDGQVVFVRHALPGERVVAIVTSGGVGDRFLRADAVRVLRSSPHRVTPPCPAAAPELGTRRCGGCDLQAASLPYQRELKAQVVSEQLRRLAGIEWPARDAEGAAGAVGAAEAVEPLAFPTGYDDGLRWRTRLELSRLPDGAVGLLAHRSHDVVPVQDCLIASSGIAASGVFDPARPPAGADLAVARGVDVIDTATLSMPEGEVVAVALPVPEGSSVPVVRERVAAAGLTRDFAVSARGFWQVHPAAAATFVDAVASACRPAAGESVLDLYCGVGLFGGFLGELTGGAVTGVEGDKGAVALARDNLADLAAAGAPVRLEAADVSDWLTAHADELAGQVDLVILDPPRTGAGPAVIEALTRVGPRAVAYVACDPAALGRDLGTAAELGWQVEQVRAFDAFPMTHHVECLALLTPPAGAGPGDPA